MQYSNFYKIGHLTSKIVVIVLICAHYGFGCAPMTHTEIGERARQFLAINSEGVNYTELILKHPDAYQAGCPYPDAYYPGLCFDGNYHDVSEETHWTPFLNATVNYIRRAYQRPWNETAEKLVVFLLAVIQHQVADVNWHSLGIDQGFLETMGKVNYHGSYGAAHSDGDFGGDVINLYGLDMDYIPLVGTWYVPVDDLLNIYTELYGRNDTMLPEVVVECTNWLFLGRLGENLGVIEYLYPEYAEASPFMLDRLQDFFLGGIDDMAVWSANVYGHAVTMLDHGTEVCDLPRNPIYIQCNVIKDGGRRKRDLSSGNDERLKIVRKQYNWLDSAVSLVDPDDYVIDYVEGGVTFSATEHYMERVKSYQSKRAKDKKNPESSIVVGNVTLPDVFYKTELNYSRLGESLLSGDVNGDGDLDLVIGAPGYGSPGNYQRGAVYVVFGTDTGLPNRNLTVEEEADIMLEGPELNGRFGASLAIVDLNADGYKDLAVGAPSVGSESLDYFGQVYVYFGSLSGISLQPDVTITCSVQERYCNLGWTLASGDVNEDGYDDLLLGAPFAPSGGEQRGFAGVLYSRGTFTGGDLSETDFDWKVNGEQDYEWFGYSVTYTKGQAPGEGRIVIGSPTYRLCNNSDCEEFSQDDIQSVGKVYTFTTTSLEHTVSGNVSFGQLGYTVSASSGDGTQLLGIAATTLDYDLDIDVELNSTVPIFQLGYVSLYDSSDLSQGPFFSVVGDREFGRSGAVIKYLDLNQDSQTDVIISAPLRSETIEEGREQGRVYVFLTDEAMRGELYLANEADLVLGIGEEKSRFGYSVAPVQPANGKVQVAVSAPHSNRGGRLSGLVTVHQL